MSRKGFATYCVENIEAEYLTDDELEFRTTQLPNKIEVSHKSSIWEPVVVEILIEDMNHSTLGG